MHDNMHEKTCMGTKWKEKELTNESITEITEDLRSYLEKLGEESRNTLRVVLAVEEILLRIRDSRSETVPVRVMVGRSYGRHIFKIEYRGESFDPTDGGQDANSILETIGIVPSWEYRRGENSVSMVISGRAKRGYVFKIVLAVISAVLLGILGKYMSDGVRTSIDNAILVPLMNVFLGLLSTFAGFMIAFTISSGVLGVGDRSALSKIGKRTILRFIGISFLTATVAMIPAYLIIGQSTSGGTDQSMLFNIKDILGMIFDIAPSNSIASFETGNSLQIIVIGVFVGAGLLALGEKTKHIRSLVMEAATLSQWLTSSVCSLVPVFVFVAVIHQVWSGDMGAIASLWKPIIVLLGINLVWIVLMIIYSSIRAKCSPLIIVKKILPASIVAFTTASSMAAFTLGMENCEKKLGVNRNYVRFAYPLGNVVYMLGTIIYLMVISVFFAKTYNVQITPMWLLTAVITVTFLAIAVPPLPGAGMMLFSILFSQLGIPENALLIATALEVVIDFFDTGFNVFFLQLEILSGARARKLLDRELLLNKE